MSEPDRRKSASTILLRVVVWGIIAFVVALTLVWVWWAALPSGN